MPVAFQVAKEGERPDLATAVVVADPIATGYYLSQADIARYGSVRLTFRF